jgi:arginine repressor
VDENVLRYNRLRKSQKLLRRARIRAVLAEHQGIDGISSYDQMADILGVSTVTVETDFKELGAVKIKDRIDGRNYSWWIIPAHNPHLNDVRQNVSQGVIEQEVALKLKAHALTSQVVQNTVIITTERSAGLLVADWIRLLNWPDILHVIENRDSCVVVCPDVGAATMTHKRLTGDDDLEDLLEDE